MTARNNIYWFGDSWVAGDELEMLVDNKQEHTFAHLVSKELGYNCINVGVSGSSVNYLPHMFSNYAHEITKDDIVIFCLTASHRHTTFTESGKPQQIRPTIEYNNYNGIGHPDSEQWYKYFDTVPYRRYIYDMTINLLHFWCKDIGVTHFFANLFTKEELSDKDEVLKDFWLLPRTQCLVDLFGKPKFDHTGCIIMSDGPNILESEWEYQQQCIEKYIRPCYAHPNLLGHKVIAEHILGVLDPPTQRASD